MRIQPPLITSPTYKRCPITRCGTLLYWKAPFAYPCPSNLSHLGSLCTLRATLLPHEAPRAAYIISRSLYIPSSQRQFIFDGYQFFNKRPYMALEDALTDYAMTVADRIIYTDEAVL